MRPQADNEAGGNQEAEGAPHERSFRPAFPGRPGPAIVYPAVHCEFAIQRSQLLVRAAIFVETFRFESLPCHVLYGPNGVDLSAFKCTSSAIDKHLERSFGSIRKWLQRGFRVDPLTHVMTVQTLVNWEVESDL